MKESKARSLEEMDWKLDDVFTLRLTNDPLFSGKLYDHYCSLSREIGSCLDIRRDGVTVRIYAPQIAMILETREIEIYNRHKQCLDIIDGTKYVDSFIKGFIEGEEYFEKNYGRMSSDLYGNNAQEFIQEILNQYSTGWIHAKGGVLIAISDKTINEFGYYSGLVFCTENLRDNHRKLFDKYSFDKFENSIPKAETNTSKLIDHLKKFDFLGLSKTSKLSTESQKKLLTIVNSNGLPYAIAMFDFLGFLEYLEKEHFKTNTERDKEISKWFGTNNERTVRGNINSLVKKSTENMKRYTAHLHTETVRKDYQSLI